MPEDNLKNLYSVLKRDGYYTKSESDFRSQWADESYRQKVYDVVKRDGLYSKSMDEFMSKYSVEVIPEEPVKKKDVTGLSGALASTVSPSKDDEDPITKAALAGLTAEPKSSIFEVQKEPVLLNVQIEEYKEKSKSDDVRLEEWKQDELVSNPMANEEVLNQMIKDPSYREEILKEINSSPEQKAYKDTKRKVSHAMVEMGDDPNFVHSLTKQEREEILDKYIPEMINVDKWSFLDADKPELGDDPLFWTERSDIANVAINYPLHPDIGIGATLDKNPEYFNKFFTDRFKDLETFNKGLSSKEEALASRIKKYESNPTDQERASIDLEHKALMKDRAMMFHALDKLNKLKSDYKISYSKYLESEGGKGSTAGMVLKNLSDGLMTFSTALAGSGTELLAYAPSAGGPDVYHVSDEDIKEAQDKGIPLQRLMANKTERFVREEVLTKTKDFWNFGTTDEWEASEDRSDIQRVLGFVSNSVGTVMAGGGTSKMSSLAFMTQSYDDIKAEMSGEEFDSLSLFEKNLIAVPYAAAMGQLEKIGYVASTGSGKAVNNLIRREIASTIGRLPKNAPKSMIDREIKNSISARFADGTFRLLAGGGIESLTEGSQQLGDISWKGLVNKIYEYDFFDVPDLSTREGRSEALKQIKEDSWYGLLAGFMMGGPSISYKVIKDGFNESAGDKEFENFKNLITDEALKSLSIDNLKSEIAKGTITKEEAEAQLDAMARSIGIIESIPDNLSLRDQKDSFMLIKERQDLEKKIEKTEKALAEKEIIRINEINEELKAISTGKKVEEEVVKEEAVKKETETTEEVKTVEKTLPGAKLFSEPNPETKQIADKYKKDKGIDTPEGEAFRELDEVRAKEIADAYQAMEDNPNDPEVREAYEAMAAETLDQYQAMQDAGYTIELWEGEGEPYANSGEMIADVRDNKHMYVLSTENEFGDEPISDQKRSENPLLRDSGIKDVNGKTLLVNDIFRGVHDFFGHTERGNSFGPKGEENAWDVHARMYSDKARRAMTTETRGQNSYVNFSGVNAEAKAKFAKANKLEKEGKIDEANKLREEARSEFKFAEQKIGLMPEEFSNIEEKYTKKEEVKPEDTFESVFTKSTEKAAEALDATIKKLDKFGKETLGVNIPVVVAKKALQAAKLAVNTANTVSEVIDAAIQSVKESDWYKGLDKNTQKKAEAFTQKLITDPDSAIKGKAPKGKTKVKKDIDKSIKRKKKKVKVDEYTALKDQLRLEARAAKQGSKWERENRKVIHEYLKKKFKGFNGKLNGIRVGSILNKALTWNLSNPVMARRFEAYVEKVVADSRKVSKIKSSQKNQQTIKKLAKAKDLQISMKEMALAFAEIDPMLVEYIDAHLEMAEKVKALITKSKTKPEGKGVDRIMKAVWAEREGKPEVDTYIKEQKKKTEDLEKSILISAYPQLESAGKIGKNKTLKQVKQAINEYKLDEKALDEADQNKDLIDNLKQEVVEEFNNTKATFKVAVESGIDPVTGEKLTKAQTEALKLLAEADVKSIGEIREIMFIRDIMHNFTMNGVTDMVAQKAKYIAGRKGAKEMEASTKKGRTLNKKGISGWAKRHTKEGKRWYNGLFAQMDQYMRGIFKDTDMVLKFKKLTGFGDLENGSSKAKNIARKAKKAYHDKYIGWLIGRKRKPNGRDFYDKYNVYQRGVYAYLSRNSGGTEQEIQDDFNRRLGVVTDSYEYLSSTGKYEGEARTVEEEQQAEILKEVLSDMGISPNQEYSLSDLEVKTDKVNKEAVSDIVNMWSESADQLEEAMGLLYNSKLDRDINYTHDSWIRKDGVKEHEQILSASLDGGSMSGLKDGHLSTSQSGALMEATKPSKTTPTRRLNFEFEQAQFRAYEAAMMDIHMAGPIHQMKGFFESKASRNILTKDELIVLRGRMVDFVAAERGGVFEEELESKGIKKVFNALSTYATAKVLGGPKALFLQTIPAYVNMIINTGRGGVGVISHYLSKAKSVTEWIDNEGIDLALRGVKSQADVYINENKMTKNSAFDKLKRAPKAVADFWINNFLVFGDKGIAKASFMAYYKQYYMLQGMNTIEATRALNNDIKSGKMNEEAREYAKHKFNTFGNVSNENLMGKMFTKGGPTGLIRKVLFPYATFVMNQKTRMWNDLSIISTKGVTPKEKWMSVWSIGSTIGESLTYHASRVMYSAAVYTIVSGMMGWDDEDDPAVSREVNKKNKKRRIEGKPPMNEEEEKAYRGEVWREMQWSKIKKGTASSLVADVFSPAPMFDNNIKSFINDVAITPIQRSVFDKELKDAIKEKNDEVFKLSGGKQKEMTPKELEKFIADYEQNEFFELYDRDMPGKGSYGVLSITADQMSEWGKYYEAAVNGRVEIEDSRGNITVKYLTKEDQESAAAINTVKLLTDLMIIPPDLGGYSHRKGWKIIEKSALTARQMTNIEVLNDFFKENDFDELTTEERKLIKNSNKSIKGILKESRGGESKEAIQWHIDEAIRKAQGMTDKEYLDWKLNDMLIERGLK